MAGGACSGCIPYTGGLLSSTTPAILASATALLVYWAWGGWEWALLGLVVAAAQWGEQFEAGLVIATFAVNLLWLLLFQWTGDRRLFFCFAMQCAVQMMYLARGRTARPGLLGGGGLLALFLLIRIWQGASASVLAVELVVAVVILTGIRWPRVGSPGGWPERVVAGMLGSTLAFLGLAL